MCTVYVPVKGSIIQQFLFKYASAKFRALKKEDGFLQREK